MIQLNMISCEKNQLSTIILTKTLYYFYINPRIILYCFLTKISIQLEQLFQAI